MKSKRARETHHLARAGLCESPLVKSVSEPNREKFRVTAQRALWQRCSLTKNFKLAIN